MLCRYQWIVVIYYYHYRPKNVLRKRSVKNTYFVERANDYDNGQKGKHLRFSAYAMQKHNIVIFLSKYISYGVAKLLNQMVDGKGNYIIIEIVKIVK